MALGRRDAAPLLADVDLMGDLTRLVAAYGKGGPLGPKACPIDVVLPGQPAWWPSRTRWLPEECGARLGRGRRPDERIRGFCAETVFALLLPGYPDTRGGYTNGLATGYLALVVGVMLGLIGEHGAVSTVAALTRRAAADVREYLKAAPLVLSNPRLEARLLEGLNMPNGPAKDRRLAEIAYVVCTSGREWERELAGRMSPGVTILPRRRRRSP